MPQKTLEIPDDMLLLRSGFVELGFVSCFSFLRGASDAVDLVLAAARPRL
jgi:error-prone DNA polymerase